MRSAGELVVASRAAWRVKTERAQARAAFLRRGPLTTQFTASSYEVV